MKALALGMLLLGGCAMRLQESDRRLLESIKADQDTIISVIRLGRRAAAAKDAAAPATAEPVKIKETGSPVIGDSVGSRTLVVFTDFQCPYCVRAASTYLAAPRLKRAGIRAVIKHFPLEGMHPAARDAALGAIVAQRHGQFSQFFDSMTVRPTTFEAHDVHEVLRKILGPGNWADSCQTKDVLDQLSADQFDASRIPVKGTPTFLLDGQQITGQALVEAMRK